eukprot:jgi/Tetstr1/422748/TSEL_013545.t1
MRTQLSLLVQFGGLGFGDNVVIADASHIGAIAVLVALATPTLEPDAGANVSAPMWAVELRAAQTRVVHECGDAVLEDLAGPLASALKLLPSKRSHVARAGCSAAGAEPACAMRSAADLQAIPHYSDLP